MTVNFNNQEYMGLFGLTFEEKVASFVRKQLKGTAAAKKLSSFFQAGGLNVTLIKNLYNEYAALMAKNHKPADFTVSPDAAGNGGAFSESSIQLAAIIGDKTNVDNAIVLSFLKALYVLSRDGKIPFSKWNPAGYKESTELRKSFATEQDIFQAVGKAAGKAAGTSKILLIVAGIGVTAYLLSQIKAIKGTK